MSPYSRATFLPVVLSVGGSDSSGGAGIQADLKTFAALGCYGTCALTAITAQNTGGVLGVELVSVALLTQQIEAVATDAEISSTKTGMLGSVAAVEAVAEAVERYALSPVVVDPVMMAKSGDPLIDAETMAVLAERLLPLATVITPNVHEAVMLLDADDELSEWTPGHAHTDTEVAGDAARALCERYQIPVCVITGVNRESVEGKRQAVDVWCHGREVREVVSPRHETRYVHGSGCTHSAAIAACLARGADLNEALITAKQVAETAVACGTTIGKGPAQPVDPLAWVNRDRAESNGVHSKPVTTTPPGYADAGMMTG